jgi:hypothetical protein
MWEGGWLEMWGNLTERYAYAGGLKRCLRRAEVMNPKPARLQENSPQLISRIHSKFTSLQSEEDRGLCTRHNPQHLSHTETCDCGRLPISQSYMISPHPGRHTSHSRIIQHFSLDHPSFLGKATAIQLCDIIPLHIIAL